MTTHSAANPSPGARGQTVARLRTHPTVESPTPQRAIDQPVALSMVSVEMAVYAFLVLFAAAIRFWDLGSQPLSSREAGLALAGIRFDDSAPPADVGAWLRHGSALIMALFGATDFSARLLPALAGAAMPLAAWLLRPLLGHTVTVIGAGVLAFSPMMVEQSRMVGNGSIVAVLTLVSFALGARLILLGMPDSLWPLTVALGLLVVSGPTGLSALTVLVLLIVAVASIKHTRRWRATADVEPAASQSSPGVRDSQVEDGLRLTWPDNASLRSALVVFALTITIMASGALTNVAGIGETIARAFGSWIDGSGRVPPESFTASLWILPAYEPLVHFAGIVGGAIAWRTRNLVGCAIVTWAILSFLLASIRPGRQLEDLALLVVPLAFLTAIAITHLIVKLIDLGAWRAVGAVVLAMMLLAALQVYVTSHLTDPRPFVGDAVIVMPMLTAALVVTAFLTWSGKHVTGLGIASFAVLAMIAFSIHSTWQLAYFATGNVSGLSRQFQTTADARVLVQDVDDLLSVLSMGQHETSVTLTSEFALPLAWYLRNIPELRVESALVGSPSIAIVGGDSRPPVGTYTGQSYLITIEGQTTFDSWRQLWRWWLYREPVGETIGRSATVFVRGQ